jgi:hypothetical protein
MTREEPRCAYVRGLKKIKKPLFSGQDNKELLPRGNVKIFSKCSRQQQLECRKKYKFPEHESKKSNLFVSFGAMWS